MLQIVLVNTYKVINSRGGTEKVFCELANALSDCNFSVTAICCDSESGYPAFPLSERVCFINASNNKNIPLFSKGLFKKIRSLRFTKRSLELNRKLIECEWMVPYIGKAISKLGVVDLYISFQPETTYILKGKLNINTPIITTFHGSPLSLMSNPAFDLYGKSINATQVLTVLMPSYVTLVKKNLKKVSVEYLPNAITNFQNLSHLSEKKIVCVARLSNEKRVELLVQATAILKKKYKDWRVEFWGEVNINEKYKEKIFSLCDFLDVREQFRFCGETGSVESVLDDAAIFAFPSSSEGFSLAVGEAMSKGIPVVGCRDCLFMNEIVKNGDSGFLVDPDPITFSEALEKLMVDYDLRVRMGRTGKAIISEFEPHKIWNKWFELIEKVLKQNKSESLSGND